MNKEDPRDLKKVKKRLEKHGQGHVLRFWNKLDGQERQKLLDQIAEIDFDLIERLSRQALADNEKTGQDLRLEPAEFITLEQRKSLDPEAESEGENALRAGKVAAFLVAGGQGTRLGFDGPKGMFPVTPVKKKSLFQLHAEKLLAIGLRYHKIIPWYIMTSETNHAATVSFFRDNDFFGYKKSDILFFAQEMIPAIDRKGRLILDEPGHIFTNPNGHGGSLKALWKSGAIKDMKDRGVEYIFYFQVDNVLTRICDPVYIGYHIMHKSEMSNKVVRKKSAEEKMGVLCKINGKLGLIEYSDIGEENMQARNADGSLKFWAGNIATHMLSVAFVERENKDGFRLPYHIAEKSIPYLDANGRLITPKDKNGIKFETFVFDALQDAERTVSIEIIRSEEFSPLKNKDGDNSPETVRRALNNTYRNWLSSAGYDLKLDANGEYKYDIEISPLIAIRPGDLKGKKYKINPDDKMIYLG